MKQIEGLRRGMGIGGWLTNYKRFNVLPEEWRMPITVGDREHFRTWRENWMRDVIGFLNENGIPYCVWNYLSTSNDGNRFSLVDDDHRKILSDTMLHIINGTE